MQQQQKQLQLYELKLQKEKEKVKMACEKEMNGVNNKIMAPGVVQSHASELEPTFKPLYNSSYCQQMYLFCKSSNNTTIAKNTSMTNKLYIGDKVLYDYSIQGNENLTYLHAKAKQHNHILNHCTLYNMNQQRTATHNTTITTKQKPNNNNNNPRIKQQHANNSYKNKPSSNNNANIKQQIPKNGHR